MPLDLGARTRQSGLMLIFKIFRPAEWAQMQANGQTQGAPVDLADGFVHFSTADQVVETAARHFCGEDGLVLLALDAGTLGDALKWEPSRGGALFPHLYAPLMLADVLWHKPLLWQNTHHIFPSLEL